MLAESEISSRLSEVWTRVAAAASTAGRAAESVTLIAVSKGQPAAAIRAAYAAGQRDFGESYVQEWQDKAARLADCPDLRWHFLGHLQRNKCKQVIGKVHLLHTVDDMQGLDEMARIAWQQKVQQDVLLQVNLAEEQTKRGCGRDDVELFCDVLLRSPGLKLRGLMLLPPFDADPEQVRPWFHELAGIAKELQRGAPWLLSMGMSGDFEVAIAEGATHVRIGTAIFGTRG